MSHEITLGPEVAGAARRSGDGAIQSLVRRHRDKPAHDRTDADLRDFERSHR